MTLPFTWREWARLDALALAALVRDRKVTAREIAGQAATAVELTNPSLGAVLEVFEDAVIDPERSGARPGGPLFGVPMFWKDSGSGMAGRLRECGSLLTAGQRSDGDCPLTLNMRTAGLNILGRSTLPEWGKTFDTTLAYQGRLTITRNPWDLDRSPGGSSGGSAALVAACVVPIAKTGDAAGSTRVPAAFTGLVGLKPSRGLLPPPTGTNELTNHRIQEGVLTRTVRDQAAALDHMIRSHPGANLVPAASPPPGAYSEVIQRPPRPLRVALSTGPWGRPGQCHPTVASRIRQVGQLLSDLGHHVDEVNDDQQICTWEPFWHDIATGWIAGAGYWLDLAERRRWSRSDLETHLTPQNRNLLRAYDQLTLREFKNALNGNARSTREVGAYFQTVDVLLCPVFPELVPAANGPYSLLNPDPFTTWFDRLLSGMRYTVLGNETGIPGLAVPAGLDQHGLPVGAMLYSAHHHDGLLLQLATQLQAAQPDWYTTTSLLNRGVDVQHVSGCGRP